MLRLRLVETDADPATPLETPQGGHMKVAFTTHDMHTLDAHFAGARNIAIYDVSPDGHRFLEAVRFDAQSKEDGVHNDTEDRLASRLEALQGCALVFVLAIGGPAAARVVAQKVHPVKLPRPEPIADILDRLQTMLAGTPPPWLRKALKGNGATDEHSFAEEDEA